MPLQCTWIIWLPGTGESGALSSGQMCTPASTSLRTRNAGSRLARGGEYSSGDWMKRKQGLSRRPFPGKRACYRYYVTGEDLRKGFRAACSSAESLSILLSQVTGLREGTSGGRTGRLDHSQPPWAAPAALALLDLHAWVRRKEAEWKQEASLPVRRRGGSDANTLAALKSLSGLSTIVSDASVLSSLRELSRWERHARVVLGELELPRRLPRSYGAGEPACPFCHIRALRMHPLQGMVRCVNPECRDADGRRPVARMEWSGFTGQLELIWQDGGTGLTVMEAQ